MYQVLEPLLLLSSCFTFDCSRAFKFWVCMLKEAHVADRDGIGFHLWAAGRVPRGPGHDRPCARGPTAEGGVSGGGGRAAHRRRTDRWRLPRLQHDDMAAAVIAPAD